MTIGLILIVAAVLLFFITPVLLGIELVLPLVMKKLGIGHREKKIEKPYVEPFLGEDGINPYL